MKLTAVFNYQQIINKLTLLEKHVNEMCRREMLQIHLFRRSERKNTCRKTACFLGKFTKLLPVHII